MYKRYGGFHKSRNYSLNELDSNGIMNIKQLYPIHKEVSIMESKETILERIKYFQLSLNELIRIKANDTEKLHMSMALSLYREWYIKILESEKTHIDEKDFLKALNKWYWALDEYNDWNNEEFTKMLTKYGYTVEKVIKEGKEV